jgi:hypothetical protein
MLPNPSTQQAALRSRKIANESGKRRKHVGRNSEAYFASFAAPTDGAIRFAIAPYGPSPFSLVAEVRGLSKVQMAEWSAQYASLADRGRGDFRAFSNRVPAAVPEAWDEMPAELSC